MIRFDDTRKALAEMSAAYFGYPAEELTTIGITGTKGKTTITYMIQSVLEHAGQKTGLIGTIETVIGDEKNPFGQYDAGILRDSGIFPEDGGCGMQKCRHGSFFTGTDAPQGERLYL